MKINESGENYLETILVLKKRNGTVRAIDIATDLGFSKPSVSVALKGFRENGLIVQDKDGLIDLTEKGREKAEKVLERHKVLLEILTSLGVSFDQAQIDACKIEHSLSDETFEKIKEFLKQERK